MIRTDRVYIRTLIPCLMALCVFAVSCDRVRPGGASLLDYSHETTYHGSKLEGDVYLWTCPLN